MNKGSQLQVNDCPGVPILAVDFGLKRIGLAVCDPGRCVAVGAGYLEGISGRKLARAIKAEALKRNTDTVLIGKPPEGARGVEPVINGADNLADTLLKWDFRVLRWDESYTTSSVLSARRQYGGKARTGKGWIDEASAVLILQDFLDHERTLERGSDPAINISKKAE